MSFRKAILGLPLVRTLMFGTIMLSLPSAAVACGYHNDVALLRGVLNWVYPELAARRRCDGEGRQREAAACANL